MRHHASRQHRPQADRNIESGESQWPEVGVPARSAGQPLPGWVRSYFEERTGHDLSPVRIHQDHRAEQLDALAYTRGPNIHFRPGLYNPHHTSGRQLLAHELRHYAQQKEGRVPMPGGPGAPIHQDARLENEADRGMAAKAGPAQAVGAGVRAHGPIQRTKGKRKAPGTTGAQQTTRKIDKADRQNRKAGNPANKGRKALATKKATEKKSATVKTRRHDRGRQPRTNSAEPRKKTAQAAPRHRRGRSPDDSRDADKRARKTGRKHDASKRSRRKPRDDSSNSNDSKSRTRSRERAPRTGFSTKTKAAARKKSGLSARQNLSTMNGAIPHRMSFENMRGNVERFTRNKSDKGTDFIRWTNRFLKAGKEMARTESDPQRKKHIEQQTEELQISRKELLSNRRDRAMEKDFIGKINTYIPNVPDVGQQRGRNLQVSKYPHLNMLKQGKTYTPSPMSRVVLRDMSPERLSEFPVDDDGNLVPVHGPSIPLKNLKNADQKRIQQIGTKHINADLKNYDSKKGYT